MKSSSFQTILMVVFLVVFAGAILVFSGLLGGGTKKSTKPTGNVAIWGIIPKESMQSYIDNFNISSQGYTISYEEHSPENFQQDLTVALADGASPDAVIVSSEIFSSIKSKIYLTPFAAYTERTFRDTNVDGAQIFLDPSGIVAMPLVVDPLVVYYNRDILAASNFVVPPTTWDDLASSIPLLTRRDSRNAIVQSTVGLGQYQNVNRARDILSALFLQSGNSIVSYNASTKSNQADLRNGASNEGSTLPSASALTFYTSFSSPTNTNYSWNSALPNTLDTFLSGKSAFYIGRASELFNIQSKNPNLNFDVATLFQTKGSTRPITYGSFIAIATLKSSPNPVAGYAALMLLSSHDGVDILSKSLSLPPARRDLLLVPQQSPYTSVFFRAALSTFSWADPNPNATEKIFRDMINTVNSGANNATTAIYEATRDLQSNIR